MYDHYVVIGSSAASIAAINKLIQLKPDARITCISGQVEKPYNKCFLADYVANIKQEEELFLSLVAHKRLTVLATQVIHIDIASNKIICKDEQEIAYDALFLGMGSSQYIPPLFTSYNYHGIFNFHTLNDMRAIRSYIDYKKVKKTIIVGAGLSGIEAADALSKHNTSITLLERNNSILSNFLRPDAAEFLQAYVQQQGISIETGKNIVALHANKQNELQALELDSGQMIACDMIIIATGVRPNLQLLENTQVSLTKYGVQVNEFLQTNIANIYAGGDLIQVKDLMTGRQMTSCMWQDAMAQGLHAAYAMAGQPRPYHGISLVTQSAFFNLFFAQAGSITPNNDQKTLIQQTDNSYNCFITQEDQLQGFCSLSPENKGTQLRRALMTKQLVKSG